MNDVRLERPTPDFQVALMHYLTLFKESEELHGCGGLRRYKSDYRGWLDYLHNLETSKEEYMGRVPATQFVIVRDQDNCVIGMLNARHYLSGDLAEYGGHIGISIAPRYRSKGYGYNACCLAIDYLHRSFGIDRILYTCECDNEASAALAQSLGGHYEKTVHWTARGVDLDRYWINAKGDE